MRTVIITIKPRHLNDILAGKKSLELRKTFPKIKPPFNVECCESGSGGQIKGQFICEGIKTVYPSAMDTKAVAEAACVRDEELRAYAGDKQIYAWSVADVVDYSKCEGWFVKHVTDFGVNRPPQSWCYAKGSDAT